MENDPRYVPVGQALPATLPPLTRAASFVYAERLVKKFGKLGLGSPNQVGPARLADWGIFDTGRRCWASTRPTSAQNHHKGWGRLIHDVSHIVFAKRHPTMKPHAGGHAAVEREIAEYVALKGWLVPKPVKDRPNLKVLAYERQKVRLKEWITREKRAHNKVKKLRRAIARYERSLQP